ncbi:hypothetical protein ACOJUR_12210 [Alicyclobacillus tolerans]|uniref:hypothetical protein n=1 Tax=Alicyclobacillus tolerans TaxID=90970 RepID=UPI003B78FC7A
MADTPRFLDWEKRLKELARDNSESIWPDSEMESLERNILSEASRSASRWLLRIWLQSKMPLKYRTEKTFERLLDESDDDAVDLDDVVKQIEEAQQIGRDQAREDKKKPDKGPWVDVPQRPKRILTSRLKVDKTAEWMARQSAASKMREWAEGMREDVRWQVVQAIREGLTPADLANRLEERWDRYGQNFQMIAVTEMSMAYNDAVLDALKDDYVVIPPMNDDKVCRYCARLLEGKVFWVSPHPIPNATKQENEQYMWVGKSNVGRKQKDWIPCVPLHPNCRHILVRYRGGNPYNYRPKRG